MADLERTRMVPPDPEEKTRAPKAAAPAVRIDVWPTR